MKDIWDLSETATPEQSQEATELFMSWIIKVTGIGPASNEKIDIELDIQTTTAILGASKERGISVTAAIHAAFALANVKHADPATKDKDYVSLAQFNLREYLGAPYNSAEYAANVYYTPMPIIAPVRTFREMSENVNVYYRKTMAETPRMMATSYVYCPKSLKRLNS